MDSYIKYFHKGLPIRHRLKEVVRCPSGYIVANDVTDRKVMVAVPFNKNLEEYAFLRLDMSKEGGALFEGFNVDAQGFEHVSADVEVIETKAVLVKKAIILAETI